MSHTSQDLERFKSYEKVHLRGIEESTAAREKIEALQKKDRNKWYMLLFNVIAIIFFTYSWYFDITALSDTIYFILLIVFSLNVALIFLQKRQIRELIDFYQTA